MMDEEGGDVPRPGDESNQNPPTRIKSGDPARSQIEQMILSNGSILPPDFEYGAVSFGSDGPAALRGHGVFANPTESTGDMTGRDVAVVVERDVNDSTEQKTTLTTKKMNVRRIRAANGDFPKLKGWWMHVEIPGQAETWHHDCGALRRRDMLRMAQELLNK